MRGIFKGNNKTENFEAVEEVIEEKKDIRIEIINNILCEFDNKNKKFEKNFENDYKNFIQDRDNLEINFLVSNKTREGFYSMLEKYEYEENIEFISAAYLEIDIDKRDLIEKRLFVGQVEKEGIISEFKFKLVKDERYKGEVDILQNIAQLNNLYINYLPLHLFERFYHIKIISITGNLNLYDLKFDNEIKISFDFEEFTENVKVNYQLYWNIEKVNFFATKKIIPTEKNIYFEYLFELDSNFRFLVVDKEKNIYGIINTGEFLKVWTLNSNYKLWNLYKISNLKEEVMYSNKIEIGYLKVLNEECIKNIILSNTMFKESVLNYEIYFEKNIQGEEVTNLGIFFKNNFYAPNDILRYLGEILKEIFPRKRFKLCQKEY